MKEKPINLKDEEVRLLLGGATLIVKPMKNHPEWIGGGWFWQSPKYDNGFGVDYFHTVDLRGVMDAMIDAEAPCAPGDVLWVREAFCNICGDPCYRADNEKCPLHCPRWRPAQHMPRELARLELSHIPVVKVGCCQVQGILPAEVLAIGVDYEQHSIGLGSPCDEIRMLHAFQNHFNTLYPGAWEENRWVWKIWRAA